MDQSVCEQVDTVVYCSSHLCSPLPPPNTHFSYEEKCLNLREFKLVIISTLGTEEDLL